MSSSHVVLLDCDIAVASRPTWPLPAKIAAKRVDASLPPERILRKLLEESNLIGQWADADLVDGPEGRRTLRNNCNGGVYVIARSFVGVLADAWKRWADWCLDRVVLFEQHASHIDQVSFALALAELQVDVEPLDRQYNCPTHLSLSSEYDCSPVLLHYHRHVDSQFELKAMGLPGIDSAIARVNQRIATWRSKMFLKALFWEASYELYPDVGSGVASRGDAVACKRRMLCELVEAGKEKSVLDVGCGDLEVSSMLEVNRYTGIDTAPSAIEIARRRRPDWRFCVADASDPEVDIEPADTVICLDVLVHQPTHERYEALVRRLVAVAQGTLIVAGYDDEPVYKSPMTYFHEPLSETLERIGGFDELTAVGGYGDVTMLVARRNAGTGHSRDIRGCDVTLMSPLVDDPLLFRKMVDLARSTIGFFPAHKPRAIEYTWIGLRLGTPVKGLSVVDVGAGVNPLPFWLAQKEAKVVTIDNHPIVRDPANRRDWNEWGFLDYSRLDSRIRSIHTPFESVKPERQFDVLYSISVIEHLASKDRGAWMSRFAEHLRPSGRLLLTVDLVPWSDALWPYREGVLVEEAESHGSLHTLVEQLQSFGFAISSVVAKTHLPKSRVGVGLIEAQLKNRV